MTACRRAIRSTKLAAKARAGAWTGQVVRRMRRLPGGRRIDACWRPDPEARSPRSKRAEKNLLVHFASGDAKADRTLHVHLQMRGRVELRRSHALTTATGARRDRGDRDARDARARAPVARLIRTKDLVRDRAFRDLGPDVLGSAFDRDEARRRLRLRNERSLGEALLDQGAVAGIGNVWKSELCFLEHLDPYAAVEKCSDTELDALLERARGA